MSHSVVQAVFQAVFQTVVQAVVQAFTQNKAYLSNVQDRKKYIILSFYSGAFSSGAFNSGAFNSGKCCFPNYHFKNKNIINTIYKF